MTTPAPDDRVNVRIADATVRQILFDGSIAIRTYGGTHIAINPDHPDITITPHADGGVEGVSSSDIADVLDFLSDPMHGWAYAIVRALLAELDRLRAPAGIEAAIEAGMQRQHRMEDIAEVVGNILVDRGLFDDLNDIDDVVRDIVRAAAVHLDAGRAELEAEVARLRDEVGMFEARDAVHDCEDSVDLAAARARVAELEAESVRLNAVIQRLHVDYNERSRNATVGHVDEVEQLRAELAKAHTTIRALGGYPTLPPPSPMPGSNSAWCPEEGLTPERIKELFPANNAEGA